jgi:hypothetical protein
MVKASLWKQDQAHNPHQPSSTHPQASTSELGLFRILLNLMTFFSSFSSLVFRCLQLGQGASFENIELNYVH